jgi:hypothetical protein
MMMIGARGRRSSDTCKQCVYVMSDGASPSAIPVAESPRQFNPHLASVDAPFVHSCYANRRSWPKRLNTFKDGAQGRNLVPPIHAEASLSFLNAFTELCVGHRH